MCGTVSGIEACIPALRRHATALLQEWRDVDAVIDACLSQALDQTWEPGDQSGVRNWLFAIMYGRLASPPWRARLRRAGTQVGRDARRNVGHLTEERFSVLLLVTIEDLTHEEIAQVLGTSADRVMALLADGRECWRRLGGIMADAGPWRMA